LITVEWLGLTIDPQPFRLLLSGPPDLRSSHQVDHAFHVAASKLEEFATGPAEFMRWCAAIVFLKTAAEPVLGRSAAPK
jgi:hypothetical protein